MDFKVLKAQAELGDAKSQYELSKSYVESIDYVNYNYPEEEIQEREKASEKWLRKAAEQGYAQAQFDLGYEFSTTYKDGQPDWENAKFWYRAAAKQNHAEACMALAEAEILDRYNTNAITEGIEWYRKGRELGHPHEPWSLDIENFSILPIASESFRMIPWLSKYIGKANRGKIDAQYSIACLYAHGDRDVPPNLPEAYAWFRVAARELQGREFGELSLEWDYREAPVHYVEIRAARAVKILELAFDEEELSRALTLANEYVAKHGPKIGKFYRRSIKYGSWWKALLYPMLGWRR